MIEFWGRRIFKEQRLLREEEGVSGQSPKIKYGGGGKKRRKRDLEAI